MNGGIITTLTETRKQIMNMHAEQSQAETEMLIGRGLKRLVDVCHGNAHAAGWWTDLESGRDLRLEVREGTRLGKALVAEKLCLIHSEVSEAMEGHRKDLLDDKLPQYSMFATELADVIIRIGDLIGALGEEDIGEIVLAKLAFNKNRPDHKIEHRMAAGGKAY